MVEDNTTQYINIQKAEEKKGWRVNLKQILYYLYNIYIIYYILYVFKFK